MTEESGTGDHRPPLILALLIISVVTGVPSFLEIASATRLVVITDWSAVAWWAVPGIIVSTLAAVYATAIIYGLAQRPAPEVEHGLE